MLINYPGIYKNIIIISYQPYYVRHCRKQKTFISFHVSQHFSLHMTNMQLEQDAPRIGVIGFAKLWHQTWHHGHMQVPVPSSNTMHSVSYHHHHHQSSIINIIIIIIFIIIIIINHHHHHHPSSSSSIIIIIIIYHHRPAKNLQEETTFR